MHLPIYSATPPNASVWIARQRLATSVTHFNSIFLLLFYYGNNSGRRATRSFSAATRQDVFRAILVAGSFGLAAGTVSEQLGVSAPVVSGHPNELRVDSLIHSEQKGRFFNLSRALRHDERITRVHERSLLRWKKLCRRCRLLRARHHRGMYQWRDITSISPLNI